MKSSDLTRAQLISIVARMRGSLYAIQGTVIHDPKNVEEILSDALEGIAVSTFDVADSDLVIGRFAPLPSELMESARVAKTANWPKVKDRVVEDEDDGA